MDELKNEVVEEMDNNEEVVEQAVETPNDALTSGVMHERDMQKVTSRQRVVKFLVQFGLYLFLGIMAVIVVFPFYWMIISSLKTLTEYELDPPTFFPTEIHWQNYANAFQKANMGRLFLNTL